MRLAEGEGSVIAEKAGGVARMIGSESPCVVRSGLVEKVINYPPDVGE